MICGQYEHDMDNPWGMPKHVKPGLFFYDLWPLNASVETTGTGNSHSTRSRRVGNGFGGFKPSDGGKRLLGNHT